MELLERELYLDALNSAFAGVTGGQGCIALVSGEAGIGKSSLIHRFLEQQRQSARILLGGCAALFAPQPLAPLHDMARQAGDDFARMLASATNRAGMFDATIDYLTRSSTPTILVIEDAHWADEATLDLIKFLGRRVQRLSIMLVVSFRDDEIPSHHPLRSVIGDLPAFLLRRVLLPALSAEAVARLATDAGQPAPQLYEVTGGNPFFVTEVLAVPDGMVPATVRDAVIARIARLSDEARAIAYVAALVPDKAERWLLQALVPADGVSLEECLRAGMVAHAHSIGFRHELARRAVEDDISLPVRQDIHSRILAALLNRGGADIPAARIVHHADQAGDSTAVLRFAPAAADEAASLGAHRDAASHFTIAIAHGAALRDEAKAELLDRLSYECYLTDQIPEAIAAKEQSLALWRNVGSRAKEGDALRWLSRLYWFTTNKALADAYASDAVAILAALPPGRELAMAYSNLAQLLMLADDADGAIRWGAKAIALASTLADTETECHALNNVGTAKLTRDDPTGTADLERSLSLAKAGNFDDHAARAYTNLATTAVRMHDFARARALLTEGIGWCEDRDLDSYVKYMTVFRAETFLALGDWQRAADDAEAIVNDAQVAPVTRILAITALAKVRARRGDPGVAALLEEANRLAWASGELQRIGPVVSMRAEAAWLQGDLDRVADELSRVFELAPQRGRPTIRGEIALWLWRSGRLRNVPDGISTAYARQIAGDWEGAARAWADLGCPYEQAMALSDSDVEGALRTALTIFEQLGATPMAGATRRKLRSLGARRIPRGAQERTKRNPHGLTRRELEVVVLLAEGRRNADIARRLFVAEKTVDHHVSAVLAKLNVRSRSEAAALANQLGLSAPARPERRAGK